MNKCSFPGCEKAVFVKKTPSGPLCSGHYAQHMKGRTLIPLRGYSQRSIKDGHSICPEEGCDRPSWHKTGHCQSHKKQIRDGDMPSEIRGYGFQNGAECNIAGCSNPAKSRGHCSSHYRQDWGPCKYPGCTRKMNNKRTGYCSSHYSQFKCLEKLKGITLSESQDQKLLRPIKDTKEKK